MKHLLKVVGITFVACFAVIMVFYCIGIYGPRLELYFMEKKGEKILKTFNDRKVAYEAAAKQDYFGGKTPEETIELYRKALVAGNIELAAKYYRVDLQEKKITNLKQALKEKGNLDYSISYVDSVLKNSKKGCNKNGDGCAYSYEFWIKTGEPVLNEERSKIASSSEPTVGERMLDVEQNPYTKVWKFVF